MFASVTKAFDCFFGSHYLLTVRNGLNFNKSFMITALQIRTFKH